MRASLLGWILFAAVLLVGCGDSGPSEPGPSKDPVPGWLKVRYSAQDGDNGGVLFTVRGPRISSVRSSYTQLFTSVVDSITVRILVAGDLEPSLVLAEIQVPDVESVGSYSATVEQVASRLTFLQRQPSTVSLTVEK